MTRPDWISWTRTCCEHYGIDFYKALGVARAEGSKGRVDFRFRKVRHYYLPWGIHDYVVKERGWPVWDIYVQTEVAVRALAHHLAKARRDHPGIGERRAWALALRKYNATCDRSYLARVWEGEEMFRKKFGNDVCRN